ncbi:MAG: beta-ketoacyl-[acyl-carrier-protein] synthase II [Candidatus Melainabacteria bacterium]|jgi:3-oxoacyl-[acyl-carrier-protein] synthase II|nr:beta-ketoacyl-[acyl-carrier-protein] synthase II [Candidatus Melainabacteria bacterium]
MSNERRVVITGIGPVTPVGIGLEDFWSSMKAGKSGITELSPERMEGYDCPVTIGGEIKNFKVTDYYDDRKILRSLNKDMDPVSQFAVVAAKYAIEDSGIDFDKLADYGTNRTKVATFVGTGIGGISTTCNDTMTLNNRGLKALGLRSIIRLMPNAASGHIGIMWGLQGRAKSDSTACASGLDSMMDAFWYIKNGLADIMVTGGSEACLNPLAISSFYNMTALSRRQTTAAEASCPFDARRDGFVMSEGAMIFTLEELSIAKKRGAKIYAELVGVGASCDAYHITAPAEDGSGGARAIEMALESAGLSDKRECIDYIHAHGTSTPLNDARETLAIKKVFGDHAYKLAVSSTKSMTGHMIGAAGPTGLAVAALACRDDIIAPTINYKEADPACDLDYVPNVARETEVNYAIVQALGFGGHNTVAIVKKFTE